MENLKEYVIHRLRDFKRSDVIISSHARIRLIQRQISEEEVVENVINPKRLEYAVPEEAENHGEEKFECYFGYTKRLCHKYVLVIKDLVVVITAVKINRRWQGIAERKLLANPRRK